MDNIFNFIMVICYTYAFTFIFKKLINNTKKNILLELKYVVIVSIIDSILNYLTIKSFKLWIYYILLQVVIYSSHKEIYKEKKFEFFIYYILTFWIFQISDIFTGIALNNFPYLVNLFKNNVVLNAILSDIMVIIIVILLTSIILNIKSFNKFILFKEDELFWIYTNVIITVYMLLIYYYNNATNTQNIIITSIIVLCFFLFISYFMFITLNKLYIEQNTRNYIEMYNNVIEESLDNMRIYRHDQKNILLSMRGFLEGDDILGLKKYFYENIDKNEKLDNKNLDGLVNIKNKPVKGLIYSKIAKANSTQLSLNVNIKEEIEDFFIKDIDMCKILGILIDNAIEACAESKEKLLNIGIWNDESEVYMVLSNSFKEKPVIHMMEQKGYSTKGENRGLGLSIVKDLNEKTYTNMTINKKIEDDLFIVEITVQKED